MSLIPETTHIVTLAERKLFSLYGIRYARGRCGTMTHSSRLRPGGEITCKRCLRMMKSGIERKKPVLLLHIMDDNQIATPEKPYFHRLGEDEGHLEVIRERLAASRIR